ncbi:rCG20537, isoform CRA_a [Rattus norvegicus]|uniref:RCG20537, isoform CRA_a n=1 Tax=Rattus norvegicus TaxID=10116 RepID=A6K5K1_RAT|nr:rCG20537, isoform CRA_a [Rattus norvegicus]
MLRTQKQGRWRLRRPSERTTMSIGSGGPGIAQLHICQGQRSAVASKARGCPLNLRTPLFPCE